MTARVALTDDRVDRCLRFIDEHWLEHWTSPTVRQVADEIGYASPSTAHRFLERLVLAGYLDFRPSPSRPLYRVAARARKELAA